MNLERFKQNWSQLKNENLLFRATMPLMAIAMVVMVVLLANDDPVVVVQPPGMNEESRVAASSANEAFKQSYALYAASMIGNVHPGNAEFLVSSLQSMLHPSIYQQTKEQIMGQVEKIRADDLSISFYPRNSEFHPDKNRSVIVGNQRITDGSTDEEIVERITYEVEVEIQNYRPVITFINVYEGTPATQKRRGQND